jgi:Flp pilus assembly protein TadG
VARCFRRTRGADERGAEAVEFALVVPMFLVLVFGVVDFGYMINHDTMINNASREGARQGALNPVANDIECTVRQSLSTVETPAVKSVAAPNCRPSSTLVTVTVDCLKPDGSACLTFATEAKSGGTVIVKVDYLHSWITPVGSTVHPGVMTLSKTTEMRIE